MLEPHFFYMVDFMLLLYAIFFYDDGQFKNQSFIDPNLLCWGYKEIKPFIAIFEQIFSVLKR